MATRRSKSYVSVGTTSEQSRGDSSPHSACRVHRAGVAQKGPELGRVTILKRDQASGKTEAKNTGSERRPRSNKPVVGIPRSRGGKTEIGASATAPRQAPSTGGGAPPRKREEWIPYVSSSSADLTPPLAGGSGRKSQGAHPSKQQKVSKGRQTGQGGSNVWAPLAQKRQGVETETRWYCSSPLPDEGAMPFRRKRSVGAQAGASWADDEYWENWDGWQKVIQWGDEEAGREQRPRAGQKDGHRVRRPKRK